MNKETPECVADAEAPPEKESKRELPGDIESEKNQLFQKARTPAGKRVAQALILTSVLAGGFLKRESIYSAIAEKAPITRVAGKNYTWEEIRAKAADNPAFILSHAESIVSHPEGKELILEIATNNHPAAIREGAKYLRYFDFETRREIVLGAASQHENLAAFIAYHEEIPDGDKLLEEAILRFKDTTLLERARYIQSPAGKESLKMRVREFNHYTVVINAENLAGLGLDDIIQEAFEDKANESVTILRYCGPFADKAWMEPLIMKAVHDLTARSYGPELILENADQLKTFPKARQVILPAVKRADGLAIMENVNRFSYLPDTREAVENAINNAGSYGIWQNIRNLAAIDWLDQELLSRAVERAAAGATTGVLANFPYFENLPRAEAILRQAVEVLTAKNPGEVVVYSDVLPRSDWGLLALKNAAEAAPKQAVTNYERYQDVAGSELILRRAAEKIASSDPSVLLNGLRVRSSWSDKLLTEAAALAPKEFLNHNKELSWIRSYGSALRRSAEAVAADNHELILKKAADLNAADHVWALGLISRAALADPGAALDNSDGIRSLAGSGPVLRKALRDASRKAPEAFIANFRYLNLKDANMINEAVDNILNGNSHKYRSSVVARKLASGDFDGIPGLDVNALIRKLVSFALGDILLYWDDAPFQKRVAESLRHSPDKSMRRILDLLENKIYPQLELGIEREARCILLILENPEISSAEMYQKASDENAYFEFLASRAAAPAARARAAIENELAGVSLKKVYEINSLHEAPPDRRFAGVAGADSKELYYLMVFGEEELFTSSFNGLFDLLKSKMAQENVRGDQLLQNTGRIKFRAFIKLASQFNRLQEFLELMPASSREIILKEFVTGIEDERDPLGEAVTIADAFGTIEDAAVLRPIQEQIKKEYARVAAGGDKQAVALYGLLAGMFGERAVVNESWIKEMAGKYKLPNLLAIPAKELFNPDGSNVQEVFFYNDEDGAASFRSFMKQYQNGDWLIQENPSYVHIVSRAGKKVEIFANRPDQSQEGIGKIETELRKRDIQTIVVVHRGHSYHAGDTIRRIPQKARIVFLGSCGGYNNINEVLRKAPKAHILATKGTGSMLINDPLLANINRRIRTGEDLNWIKIWQDAEKSLGGNPNFHNYVPPHKNLGALFIKAFNEKTGR